MKYNCGKFGNGILQALPLLPVQSACFTISSLSVRARAPDQSDFWLVRALVRLLMFASTYYSSSSSSSTAALAIQALVPVLLLPLFIPSLFSPSNCYCRKCTLEMQPHCSQRGHRGEKRAGGVKTIIQS